MFPRLRGGVVLATAAISFSRLSSPRGFSRIFLGVLCGETFST